jgi:hypothetical protein
MFTKTRMALAAALVLGVASTAQAGSKDDADAGGGYRVGPLGQVFNDQRSVRGNARAAFAYDVSPNSHKRIHRR